MLSNYIRARKVRSWEVKAGNGVVQTWDHKMPEKWADPDPSVIRGFLAKGGNPLEADAKHGLSVLHHVARQNPNPENLTRLLEEGLPLDWCCIRWRLSPLAWTMFDNRSKLLAGFQNAKVLLNFGASLGHVSKVWNMNMFHCIAFCDERFRYIFDQTSLLNLNINEVMRGDADYGFTPLGIAVQNGNFWICKRLVECGASVDGGVGEERSPILCAVELFQQSWKADDHAGGIACLKFLLEKGADVNRQHKTDAILKSKTAFDATLLIKDAEKRDEVRKVLLEYGAK